jgi:orotidine-5'-phosphate decarboxylase
MTNTSNKQASDKLIFALDASDYDEALSWIDLLSGHVGMFKVGKELFTACGPKIIEAIKSRQQKVFLDLKFHDIPNTVARAACAAVRLHVDMFNVHAAGGSTMIRETAEAVEAAAVEACVTKPVMLAVTVLTSLNDEDLRQIGFQKNAGELVLHLAGLAQAAGAAGVVASPQEIDVLRRHLPADFVIVTPGIRASAASSGDDQKRTLSAFEAVKAGADYIVVGRPIRAAARPLEVCRRIVDEIAAALPARG